MPKYKVNIAQTWSEDVVVEARSAAEAKKKAWEKYKPKKSNFTMFQNKIEDEDI